MSREPSLDSQSERTTTCAKHSWRASQREVGNGTQVCLKPYVWKMCNRLSLIWQTYVFNNNAKITNLNTNEQNEQRKTDVHNEK